MDLARPTWVEVDLDRIGQNVVSLARLASPAQLMAVVKADGYGHGALPVARTAQEAGAAWLGVASLEEGVALRQAGISVPILVMGYVSPDCAQALVDYELRAALFQMDLAVALSHVGRACGRTVPVHLKVDTGMGRIGMLPERVIAFVESIARLPYINLEGIFTHLATADEPENEYAIGQLERFEQLIAGLRAAGIEPPVRHACNSAGLMLLPRGHYDLVRAGIAIYGLPPDPAVQWPIPLLPALTWRTRVSMVKMVPAGTAISYGCTYRCTEDEQIASLPVGYADGYSRRLSNRGEVLIHGRRCSVAGRVCMDQVMIRVPLDLEVSVGDEVVLIGEQGGESVCAGQMATAIGTINYEVVCSISNRVPRLYRKHGRLGFETSC